MHNSKTPDRRNAHAMACLRMAICLLTLAATVFMCSLSAQTGRGTITGTVLDESGGAVPAAKIQVVGTETNVAYDAETNEQGLYVVPNLPRGTYKVTATKEGFAALIRQPVIVDAETQRRVDFDIRPGQVVESITVAAESPILDVSTTGNSTGITDDFIHEIPQTLNTERRVITQYLLLVPGLVGGVNSSVNDTSWTASMNGLPVGQTEVFVDGARATEQKQNRGAFEETSPTVEAVGEITVVANAFNAEYGGFGAWFTQVTIKSGNNQFHGSVYDHLQNSDLNARTFFQAAVTPLRQNEGGGTFGGPVYIPKVYDGKNKTFFFFNQGIFIAHQGAAGSLVTIPTTGFKQGDFTGLVNAAGAQIPIYDPTTTTPSGTSFVRTAFPGNVIPQSRITPQAALLVAMLPTPPLPGIVNNAYSAKPVNNYRFFDIYNTTFKLDHSFSNQNKISITYNYGNRLRDMELQGYDAPVPIEGHMIQRVTTHSGRINHDYIFTPHVVNHFTGAYDRYNNFNAGKDVGGNWNAKMGITGIPDNQVNGFPSMTFSGGTASPLGIGYGGKVHWAEQHFTFNDTLTWMKGQHEFKLGAFYGTDNQNTYNQMGDAGSFGFSNVQTSAPLNTSYGNSFASFLLGAPNSASAVFAVTVGMRNKRYAAFAQDSWRITQALTLSYGLRYDYVPPDYEVNNHLTTFNPTLPNPAAGGILGALSYASGSSGLAHKFVQPWKKGWAPRLGLAYMINRKTVVRASGGIYMAQPSQSGSSNAGFGQTASFSSPDGFSPAYYWTSPFPSNYVRPPQTSNPSFLNGQSATWLCPNGNRMPQTISWTVGIQRQVLHDLAVDVAYIGSRLTHLAGFANQNVVPMQYIALGSVLAQQVGSAAATAAGITAPFPTFLSQSTHTVAQALRPYPQYTGVNFGQASNPSANSDFHSLQIKVTKRFSHGLQVQSFFEWEKNLMHQPVNPLANRFTGTTLSSSDIPDTLQISATYELPFGQGKAFLNSKSAFSNYVVGGWQVTTSLRYLSGFPLTIAGSGSLGGLGYTQEANYVGGNPFLITNPRDFDPVTSKYLNAAAFSNPSAYAFGNLAPTLGWLRSFTQKSEAVSMSKTFRLKEKGSFEFGLDAMNPFNFHRWGNPNTSLTSSQFGMVTSTQGLARTIQINAKLAF